MRIESYMAIEQRELGALKAPTIRCRDALSFAAFYMYYSTG